MTDGTFRYIAWPSSLGMNDTPELVLYGGTHNEVGEWIFNNKEFVYIVSESGLTVMKNGRPIAKWDFV